MDYQNATVQELRTLCRERNIGSGTLIAGASKATRLRPCKPAAGRRRRALMRLRPLLRRWP